MKVTTQELCSPKTPIFIPTKARSASCLQKVYLALGDSKPGEKTFCTNQTLNTSRFSKVLIDWIHYSELYVALENFIGNIHILHPIQCIFLYLVRVKVNAMRAPETAVPA